MSGGAGAGAGSRVNTIAAATPGNPGLLTLKSVLEPMMC